MKFRKTIRLLLTFYKNFFFFSFLMTLICMGLFQEYGMSIFSTLFWLKLSTLGVTIVFIKSYKSKEFYYYQNLGLSRTFLWLCTLGFDFILYLLLLTTIHRLSAPPNAKEPTAVRTSYSTTLHYPISTPAVSIPTVSIPQLDQPHRIVSSNRMFNSIAIINSIPITNNIPIINPCHS